MLQNNHIHIQYNQMVAKVCLLFLLSLALASAQNCATANPTTDQLDAGKTLFQRTNPNLAREHCATVPLRYQGPSTGFEVAVSTSSINGYNPQGGFDYSVRGSRKGTTNSILIILFISEDHRWTSIQVSYLASSRSQIILGSFVQIPVGVSTCNINLNNFKSVAETYVPVWRLNDQKTYRVAAFISGYRTQATNFQLQAISSTIDPVDGRVVIQYQSNANPSLESIQFTYIVYPDQNEGYSYAYNGNPSGFGTYVLSGVHDFNGFNINNDQFVICRTVGGCAVTEYLVGGKCECRPGLIRVGTSCRQLCGQNAYFDDSFQCQCVPGYSRNFQGICIQSNTGGGCPENERKASNGACRCNVGYYRTNQGVCVAICKQNQVWQNGQCNCIDGYIKKSTGGCVPQPSCPENERWADVGCICIEGYNRNRFQQCVPIITCGSNEEVVNGVCRCIDGYVRNNNNVCVRRVVCNTNEGYNPTTNRCQCNTGYVRNSNNICVRVPTCRPNQTYNSATNQCECNSGFVKNANGDCVRQPTCGTNQSYNSSTGRCQCNPGSVFFGMQCVSKCGVNEQFIDGVCECIDGHAKIVNVCRSCPSNSYANADKTTCICSNSRQIFNQNSLQCSTCPSNSSPSSDGTKCDCNSGYQLQNGACVQSVSCAPNSSPNQSGVCVCNRGYYRDGTACRPVASCPPNSQWNSSKLECVCVRQNEYLIDGRCQTCGSNSAWNGDKCVCRTGYFLVGGSCIECDPNSTYNGSQCVCNRGFYGNSPNCRPCHNTCGTCSGPGASQCLSCVDISYTLENGYCSRQGACPPGSYLEGGACTQCTDFCQQCSSQFDCTRCSPGFNLSTTSIGPTTASFCQSICGDGRRVDAQRCDDGNNRNGDGCSSTCQVEDGWSCTRGSAVQRSTCSNMIPPRSIIEIKGSVNGFGRVVQGIRLSYIPTCFTDEDCINCHKILDVKVIQSHVPIQIKVNYVPNSIGQFLVQYDFGSSVIVTTVFEVMVQINKKLVQPYKSCFTDADYAQQVRKVVDSATLAIDEGDRQLTLEELLNPQKIKSISDDSQDKIFE